MKTKALLCIVTGLCTLSLCHTRQYHFIYDKRNWTDAQQHCREMFTDLATIDSMEDVKTLNVAVDLESLANPESNYGAWIGLRDDTNSWRWSLAGERFYRDAEEQKFRKWASGEPNNGDGIELCTVMNPNGEWSDYPCSSRFFAVCFKDIEPTGKYTLIEESLTWDEAQRYCRENYTDLASVRNQTEHEEIQNIKGQHVIWIGLFRDSWKWSDGSSYSFRDWNTGEPNGATDNCASLEFGSGSKWADWDCERISAFICYGNETTQTTPKTESTLSMHTTPTPSTAAITMTTETTQTTPKTESTLSMHTTPTPSTAAITMTTVPVKKQVVRIKLSKANSSLDLNNIAVQEAILEQFKQSLKDKGQPSDIKLRWVKQPDGNVFHKEDKKKRQKKKRERKPVLTKREL